MGAGKWMLALPMALGFPGRLMGGGMAPERSMASCAFRGEPGLGHSRCMGLSGLPEASVGVGWGGGRHACHRGRGEEVYSRGQPQSCLSASLLSETSYIIAISFPFSSKHQEET